MTLLQAVILGIVEGITEFLPISSTGHLILASHLLKLPPTEFLKSFEIAIQVGAIFAVIVLYWKRFLVDFETLKRVIAAFIPTGILGFVLYKIIKKYLLGGEKIVLWSLFIGGVVIVLFEKWHKEKASDTSEISRLPYSQAIWIGVFQALAMIPGVSRSATTIIGALALGVKRKTAVEFSFLLAVPTLLAATALDLLKNGASFSGGEISSLCVGAVVSFIVAMFAIKLFLQFVKDHTLAPFGIYRVFTAAIFWFFL